MKKTFLYSMAIFSLIILAFIPGCSQLPSLGESSSMIEPKIVRQAELSEDWSMQQMQLVIEPAEDIQLLLKLANGDKVDGYFYMEKGEGVEFEVMAESPVYRSQGDDPKNPATVPSDRFSFTASQAQGTTYTLLFRNPEDETKGSRITVFTEILYPSTGSIFAQIVKGASEEEE